MSTKITELPGSHDGLVIISLNQADTPNKLLLEIPGLSPEDYKRIEWAIDAARLYERKQTIEDVIKLFMVSANYFKYVSDGECIAIDADDKNPKLAELKFRQFIEGVNNG